MKRIRIPDSPYLYSGSLEGPIRDLADRVSDLRGRGRLTEPELRRIRDSFRIRHIYHSNAIEGNTLDLGETRLVVEEGRTITGKPPRDQAEARNLAEAVDLVEELATDQASPITASDLRRVHHLVLKGLDDRNAGVWRRVPVTISGSDHLPPAPEAVPSEMARFTDWLGGIRPGRTVAPVDGILAAAVAHTWFVTIHPFADGNGRVARLLLNLVLMRFGIPVAVIAHEDRMRYYEVLEHAQTGRDHDLSGFVSLLCESVHETLDEHGRTAAAEPPEALPSQGEYRVWKGAMDLLAGSLRELAPEGDLLVEDFDHLDTERYAMLRARESPKRTWFLRVSLRRDATVRFLFCFRSASQALHRCGVTLWLCREVPAGSGLYELLDDRTPAPTLRELGYLADEERFVSRNLGGTTSVGKIEDLGRQFFGETLAGS